MEQTFSIPERRFWVLHQEIRDKHSRPVINISPYVTLHNIGIKRGEIIDSVDVQNDEQGWNASIPAGVAGRHTDDPFRSPSHSCRSALTIFDENSDLK